MMIDNTGLILIMKNQDALDVSSPLSSEKTNLLHLLTKDLSKLQLSWLSGYFWGLGTKKFRQTQNKIIDAKKNVQITLISASQTGNAKSLADILLLDCKKHNISARLWNACDYPFKKINQEKIIVCIVSTHGEGEPPEEAIELYNFLMSKHVPKMNNIYFSIFGLGDTSYNLFCQFAKDIDNRLFELGAVRLLDRVDADLDYIDPAKIWREKLLIKISTVIKHDINDNINNNLHINHVNNHNANLVYTKHHPATGTILINQKITGRNSTKDIRHIEISLEDVNINYQPGDALGIWYENSSALVDELLSLLKIHSNSLIVFKNNKISIKTALKKHCELTVNTPSVINKYINFTNSKFLNHIQHDHKKVIDYSNNNSIIDMIRQNTPVIKITATQLFTLFRPISPRLYSISSSQSELNNEVHITVKVIKYSTSDKLRFGGASGYLSHSLKDHKIQFYIFQNNNFRLPSDTDSIIMVGVGTGIAPFRSFMQQRSYNQASGKNWIFFGNTHFTDDFLYQLEWQRYFNEGLLNKIDLAWSRDNNDIVYVQDKIRKNGSEIWNWVLHGAYIYICGDAKKMARDVELAFLDVFSKFGQMDITTSKKFLSTLRSNKRYQRDVY